MAELAKTVHHYRRQLFKRMRLHEDLYFNNQCLNHDLIPRYVKHEFKKDNSKIVKQLAKEIARKLIKKEIKLIYMKLNNVNTQLKMNYDKMRTLMRYEDLNTFLGRVHTQISVEQQRKRHTLDGKLKKLIDDKKTESLKKQLNNFHKFHDNLINFTQVHLEKSEIDLLEKGIKFNPTSNINTERNLIKLAAEIEATMNHIRVNKFEIRDEIRPLLRKELKDLRTNKKLGRGHFNDKVIKSIREKVERNKLTITKADKGNCMIIMKTKDYNKKVLDFLSKNNIREKKISLSTIIQKIKEVIKRIPDSLELKNIKGLKIDNTRIPRLYGLMKIHKSTILDEIPIRPVVSNCNAPTYQLSKWLNIFLKEKINFSPSYTIKNTLDLVNKIKDIKVEDHYKIRTLDIENLYTNVPTLEVKRLIEEDLDQSNLSNDTVETVCQILNLCLKQNFFQFDNKIFEQIQGLAMGYPIAPYLADRYMDYFEKTHIFNWGNEFSPLIVYYYRYVDDIIILWKGTDQGFNDFVTYLNSSVNNIKFKNEHINDKECNFLDLNIKLLDGKHSFDIFRKPTHTDVSIDISSQHHWNHKIAVFNSLLERLVNIPLNEDNFNKEMGIIKQIARKNNFDNNMIDRMLNKKLHKRLLRSHFPISQHRIENKRYFPLSFVGTLSSKVARLLEKDNNIKIAFRPTNNLRNLLFNNKDPVFPIGEEWCL
ncbi:uncharacterized protein LOC123321102 [Coccinella septempunctata]|uniref:uncharacterized protein LOC123321102 n=1 Tax=Coccinella septempunctata TaxID=41139 RepID=UPI001D06E4BA|nr:uncharacterized protein LOC123321102 [Coccinella septempunctata]